MKKKKILYIVLYLVLLNGFIQTYLLKNEFVPLVSDILLFYLAFTTKNNIRAVGNAVSTIVVVLFSILLLGSTAISIINQMSPLTIAWGLRMVLRYLLLFMMVYKYFDYRDVAKYKNIVIKFFWINAIAVAFQYFVEHKVADFIGGTFMSNGELFVFNLFAAFIMSKEYFIGKLSRIRFLLLICIEMFVAMVAEIKIMYFTIPLALYAVYVFTKKFSIKHLLILVFAFFFLVPAMKATMSLMYGREYVNQTFDMDFLEEETSKAYNLSDEAADYSFNSSTCVEMASTLILQDPFHLAFGYGIGSGNTSEKFGSWISALYSKITSYNWFTSSWLLIEYGWIGYVIWILILICLMVRFLQLYKRGNDSEIRYWSSLGFISVLFTFVIAWYNNMPYYNAYFIYLFWAICFVAVRERNKKLLANENAQ